ncbi:Mediator of RNA polymerase II transcription subunit 6 [Gryganskiella cystojenkinii]|nr:Mediator of RNA polymerase II transcription subunit 6 [Gryganskiella cystojenkinii]
MATPIMGAPSAAPETKADLLNVEWRFQEWLMGMGGLNPDNVLDYFALSPFWDPECNNAILKMQTQFNNLGEMKQRLSEMVGVEFALVHERYPTLFIIQKQYRNPKASDGPTVLPLAIYYVLHGNIFMCPDLQTLLSNRVLGSLHHVESAFNEARVMTEFHPSTGYHWKSAADSTSASSSQSLPSTSGPDSNAAGAGAMKIESQDFRMAVDVAIKHVQQRAWDQQQQIQNAASNANANSSPSIKQEGGVSGAQGGAGNNSNTQSPTGTPVTKNTKAASKRRKKTEDTTAGNSTAMGVNTAVAAAPGGRGTSAGGNSNQPTTPATPTGTTAPAKRRKKTKTAEPK